MFSQKHKKGKDLVSDWLKGYKDELEKVKSKGVVKKITKLLKRLEKVESQLPESYGLLLSELSK